MDEALKQRCEVYTHFRASPPFWNAGSRSWFVSRYIDVVSCLASDALVNEGKTRASTARTRLDGVSEVERFIQLQLELLDPPRHTELRRLFTRLLRTDFIESLRPHVETAVEEILAALGASGDDVDVATQIAAPLPARVIARALGVLPKDLAAFLGCADAIVGVACPSKSTTAVGPAGVASRRLIDLTKQLLGRVAVESPDSLLAQLVLAGPVELGAEMDAIASNLLLFFVAGQDTTANLITSGVAALLLHDEQRALLSRAPQLLDSAVEEVLRYDGPIQMLKRCANRDISVGGARIAASQHVTLLIGAANLDPTEFPDAGTFCIERTPNRHLAFGLGRHFCLGASLARLQASTVFRKVLPLLERATICGPIVRHEAASFSGIRSLRLHVGAAS